MQEYHLHAHMDRNFVRKGARVRKYKTKIGTIGNANSATSWNKMYAHDHFSIYKDLTVVQVLDYIYGWSKAKVLRHYTDPRYLDFERMYPEIRKVDVGNRGYDWLQSIKNRKGAHIGFHPGVDVNNSIGGNSDMGQPIMSSCDGVVIYEWRGWTGNRGWGNVIIVRAEEEKMCEKEKAKVKKYKGKAEKYADKLNRAEKSLKECLK